MIDATYNTNHLHWMLFIIIIQHEFGNWIPSVYMLCEHKDKDIIAVFLANFWYWYREKGG